MGRDRVMKKVATSSISSASSTTGTDEAFARLMVTRYASQYKSFPSMKKEDRAAFLEIKRIKMKMKKAQNKATRVSIDS
ncbi:hypothetical protein Tco_1525026 [Tanacetum coccineum]